MDENVFAYSNRYGHERSIIFFNNSYGSTKGTIHTSAASMNKATGELWQRTISEGLALPDGGDMILAFRDRVRGLEFLRRATDFREYGLTLDLRGYQYAVLLDWRELRSTAEQPWAQLCDALRGSGVSSVDDALRELRVQPVHTALREALTREDLVLFADKVKAEAGGEASEEAIEAFVSRGQPFFDRAQEILSAEGVSLAQGDDEFEPIGDFAATLTVLAEAVADVAAGRPSFGECWPPAGVTLLPGNAPGAVLGRNWAPALAYALLRVLTDRYEKPAEVFDRLHLRAALAEVFSGLDLSSEDAWRTAARLRLLLAYGHGAEREVFASQTFWDDGDVRWLAGVNESEKTLWFNKEALEELVVWMQLPGLLHFAIQADGLEAGLPVLEDDVTALRAVADGAGYKVAKLVEALAAPANTGAHGSAVDELPEGVLEDEPSTAPLAELQAAAREVEEPEEATPRK